MKIYTDWINAKSKLDYWKKKEQELRIKITDPLLKGESIGTHTTIKDQFKIKTTKKVYHAIDNDILTEIWDDLSEDEQQAIKFKPELLLKEYKTIDHETLDDCITVKPAMPSLTIEIIEK